MDLSYGEEVEAFRGEVKAFLDANWPPKDDGKSKEEQARAFRREAIDAGYLNRHIPKKYGGSEQEPDSMKGTVISEEFAQAHTQLAGTGVVRCF